MPIRYYQDFEILIDCEDKDPSGRPTKLSVEVLDSPMGESTVGQVICIDDWGQLNKWLEDLENFKITQAALDEFGHYLGEVLLPGVKTDNKPQAIQEIVTVRDLFDLSLQNLSEEEGLRIRLKLIPELAHLPWEFASITETGQNGKRTLYLGTHPQLSFVRHEKIAGLQRKEFRIVPRLRVVFAMASPRHPKFGDIEIDKEQKKLKRELSELKSLDIHYIPNFEEKQSHSYGASEQDIKASQSTIPPPDIFHFTGHGVWKKKQGYILLAKAENGKAQGVSGAKLAGWLSSTVRLVVLECCESAKSEGTVQKRNNVAMELLSNGVPAVIGMQYEIYYDSATIFAETLYSYLIAGLTIDEAVTQSRKKVKDYEETNQSQDLRAWGTPVLYLRNSGGNFFPPDPDRQATLAALPEEIKRDATLSGIMRQWIREKDFLASRKQLDELQFAGDKLNVDALEILLLLQSATQHSLNTGYWAGLLERKGQKLLESMQEVEIDRERKTLDLAEKTLGLDGMKIDKPPGKIDNLSWSAATHSVPIVRRTAALALLALNKKDAPALLNAALKARNSKKEKLRRRIECFSTLAEAQNSQGFLSDLHLERPSYLRKLSLLIDHLLVWGWRFLGYWKHNQAEILLRSLYAGLGAGVAFGVYRALLTLVNQNAWGSEFAINAAMGFLAGLFIFIGMGITSPLLLLNLNNDDLTEPSRKRRKRLWMQVFLGAAGFCVVNGIVVIFSTDGLATGTFVRYLFTSFLAGLLIVGVALYNQPYTNPPRNPHERKRWLLNLLFRLVTVAVLLGCMQAPVLWEQTNSPTAQLLFGRTHRWRISPLSLSTTTVRDRYQVELWMKTRIIQCDPDMISDKSCYEACADTQGPFLLRLFTYCFEQWLSVLDIAIMGLVLILGMISTSYWIPKALSNLKERKR